MNDCNIWSSEPPVGQICREHRWAFRVPVWDAQKAGLQYWHFLTKMVLSASSHTCAVAAPKTKLFSPLISIFSTKRRVSGGYPVRLVFYWVLFSTVTEQRQKQERGPFSRFVFVCNLHMLFLPLQRLKKKSLFWSLWVLAAAWFELLKQFISCGLQLTVCPHSFSLITD